VNDDDGVGRGSRQHSVGPEDDGLKLRVIQDANSSHFGMAADRARRVGDGRAGTDELFERLAPNVVDHQIVARRDQINREILALLAKPDEAGFHRVST